MDSLPSDDRSDYSEQRRFYEKLAKDHATACGDSDADGANPPIDARHHEIEDINGCNYQPQDENKPITAPMDM